MRVVTRCPGCQCFGKVGCLSPLRGCDCDRLVSLSWGGDLEDREGILVFEEYWLVIVVELLFYIFCIRFHNLELGMKNLLIVVSRYFSYSKF